MIKKSIYIDTSVISALIDDRTPERKLMTKDFWERKQPYRIFISTLVKDELETASDEIKKELLSLVSNFEVLPITNEVEDLANKYVNKDAIPKKFKNDAIHISVAVLNNIDFLVSWNFRHLVKVKTRKIVNLINEILGYRHIEIIAPPEL